MTRTVRDPKNIPVCRDGLQELTTSVHPTVDDAAEALVQAFHEKYTAPLSVAACDEGTWAPIASSFPVSVTLLAAGPASSGLSGVFWVANDEMALLMPSAPTAEMPHVELRKVLAWLTLHRQRDLAKGSERVALHAEDVVRAVSEQLRSMRDPDEVLHSIARRTLDLLDADICGVLLREGDLLRMRSCVGNRLAETAKLTMKRGQGVAGLVFATGEVGRVDDYLADDKISQDFVSLAGREETRSALAVPLMLHGDLIGVLEVWRRRASVFTELDTQRMLTLADFAEIAISNARLYEEQENMLEELTSTRGALEREVLQSRKIAELQQRLIDAVLRRPTLAALADVVAEQLECAVGIYGPEGQGLALKAWAGLHLPDAIGARGKLEEAAAEQIDAEIFSSPVVVEGESLGSVLLFAPPAGRENLDIACNQVALAVSLAHLHERAASKARAEALEQSMWDLLSGPIESRMAARSRAEQIGFNLSGPHLVAYGRLNGLESGGVNASSMDQVVSDLLRTVKHREDFPRQTLVGARGERIVTVVPVGRDLDARAMLSSWSGNARDVHQQLSITWGVSRPHSDPFTLMNAFEEAKVALSAARRMGDHNVAMYDDLGIARILLGSGSDPDVQSFVNEVTAPLVEYDDNHDGSLVQTLRAFFDANCSQKVAAERLFIHHKTMKYRLDRIHQLTGLDLSQHEDRMRADFALRLLQIHEPEGPNTTAREH